MNFLNTTAKATRALILINVLVWLGQIASNGALTAQLAYYPLITGTEPWRMITAGFAHSADLQGNLVGSLLHIGLNMYSLFLIGTVLEPLLGSTRFLYLYVLSLFGGSVAVLWFAHPMSGVVGASGAIFGLMGAYFVVLRSLGDRGNQVLGVIAINLIFTFTNPGISWEAHIGGLLIGAAVAWIYAQTRSSADAQKQNGMLIGLAIVLIALTFGRLLLPITL